MFGPNQYVQFSKDSGESFYISKRVLDRWESDDRSEADRRAHIERFFSDSSYQAEVISDATEQATDMFNEGDSDKTLTDYIDGVLEYWGFLWRGGK